MRDSELLIALPNNPQGERRFDADLLATCQRSIECASGVVCVAFDPPRATTPGGLMIPDTGANERRSEADQERRLDEMCEEFTRLNLRGLDPSDRRPLIQTYREGMRTRVGNPTDREYRGSAQERLRPDCGTVIALDECWTGDTTLGSRVLCRPYHGLCMDKVECPSGLVVEDVRFYGLTWDLEHSLLMEWREWDSICPKCGERNMEEKTLSISFSGGGEPVGWKCLSCGHSGGSSNPLPLGWQPLFDWVLIKRDKSAFEIANPLNKSRQTSATVIKAGPVAGVEAGNRILLTGKPNTALFFKWGMADYELVKETNEDGIAQIWAVVE